MKPKVQLLLRAPGQAATWEGEERTACLLGALHCADAGIAPKKLPQRTSNTLAVTDGNGHS